MYSDVSFFFFLLLSNKHNGALIFDKSLSSSSSSFVERESMDRLNTIINDLIISNEFDLITPVVKAGLLTLVRDQYLSQFLNTIEQISNEQIVTYHTAFVHFHKQLIDIENYLKTLAHTLENQYHLKLFPINEFILQLPYNAVKQQLLHTTNIIKSTFYLKFINIFEYYLAAYASQHARIACGELLKGSIVREKDRLLGFSH